MPSVGVMLFALPVGGENICSIGRGIPDSYFTAGIILARIWMEFSMIELPNPLKSVRHCKLPERQTSRVSYTA